MGECQGQMVTGSHIALYRGSGVGGGTAAGEEGERGESFGGEVYGKFMRR